MNITGFLTALRAAGLPAEWEDVRDSLWLAGILAPVQQAESETVQPEREHAAESMPSSPPPTALPPLESPRPPKQPRRSDEPVGVILPRATSTSARGLAVRIAVAPPRLVDDARITRQLRPLKRHGLVHGRLVVDEQSTVDRIAETGLWQPVLARPTGRWLDLDVVVDGGPSMALWDRTVSALVELFVRMGAFRRITVWRLDADGHRAVLRDTGQTSAPRDPRELVNPTGRSVVLLLSDGIGPGWQSGRMDQVLAMWASAGPVAIWQPLAPRLWRRTAMRVQRGILGASRPGQPTADYSVRLDRGLAARWTVGVPVVSSGQTSLGEWARLLADGGAAVTTLHPLFDAERRPPSALSPANDYRHGDPQTLITRFRTESSATAMRMAVYFSSIPLTLQTMRVAQEVMLPESNASHLAEVFLGGLLRRLSSPSVQSDQVYDFAPGVREALLAAITRAEAREVLDRVADAASLPLVQRRGFRAVLDDPVGSGAAALDAMDRPFAKVMRTVLGRLGGEHAQLARESTTVAQGGQLPDDAAPAAANPDGATSEQPWEGQLPPSGTQRQAADGPDVASDLRDDQRGKEGLYHQARKPAASPKATAPAGRDALTLSWLDIARPVELRTRDLGFLSTLDGPPAVAEVLRILANLQKIFESRSSAAGAAAAGFNHLYIATTTKVAERLAADEFAAPAFVCALDVAFALRYLAAVRGMAVDAPSVPRSWQVVLDPRDDVSPMARMAAGVNAHINFDLPFALLGALRGAATFPAGSTQFLDRDDDEASPEYRDYAQVYEIFHVLLPQAMEFATTHDGFRRWLSRLAGVRDDDELLIEAARRMPWLVCEKHLWPIRTDDTRALRRRERWIDWLVSRLGADMVGPTGYLAFGGPEHVFEMDSA